MKIKNRAVCAVLALTFVFLASSCVHEIPKTELETTEPVVTTREYFYKGIQNETTTPGENQEKPDKKDEQIQSDKKENPIKNIIEKLPEAIKPNKKDEENKENIKVKIPAGLTMTEIFSIIDSKGVTTFSELMNAAHNVDFTFYPLIKGQKNTGRAYVLEGYLCSGEYVFQKGAKPEDIIGAMLRRTESKITTQYRRQIAKQGKTIDDVIIIASIIQKESINVHEMKKVSAVINNRLHDGMKLEMQSCAMYIESDIKPYILDDDLESSKKYNEYYNTLICPALPAGPICTPSSSAIDAALNPEGEYRYFCVDEYGKYYYSVTAQEYEKDLVALGYIQPETENKAENNAVNQSKKNK